MAEWPSDLPQQALYMNYQETPPNLVIRQTMDVGPAKVRKRFTAGVRTFRLRFHFTADELVVFDEFFLSVIDGGATAFDWVHPRTGESASCRIIPPPTYTPYGGSAAALSPDWQVDVQMEILP